MNLPSFAAWAKSVMPPELKEAAFIDAGWKNGIAEIGAVLIRRTDLGYSVDAHSDVIRCEDSSKAERAAYELAIDLAVDPEGLHVFTDHAGLAYQLGKAGKKVSWIPRGRNLADRIANRRTGG